MSRKQKRERKKPSRKPQRHRSLSHFLQLIVPDKRLRSAYLIELAKLLLIVTLAAIWFSYASFEYSKVNAIVQQNQALESQAQDISQFWEYAQGTGGNPRDAITGFFTRTILSFIAALLVIGACAVYLEYEVWRAIKQQPKSWTLFRKTLVVHALIAVPFLIAAGIGFFFVVFKGSWDPVGYLTMLGTLFAATVLAYAAISPFIDEERTFLELLRKAAKHLPKTLLMLAVLGALVFLTLVLLGLFSSASQQFVTVIVILSLPFWFALVKRLIHDWSGGKR